jgi:hypothetical protein
MSNLHDPGGLIFRIAIGDLLPFKRLHGGPHVAHCIRHTGVPRGRTSHLRRVIWNNNAIEPVPFQNPQDPKHVYVTVVDERFFVIRHFAMNIPKVNVRQTLLATVLLNSVVNASLRHFSECSETKLKGVGRARIDRLPAGTYVTGKPDAADCE